MDAVVERALRPSEWMSIHQHDAKMEQIKDHQYLRTIKECLCGAQFEAPGDGVGEWAAHLADVLFPRGARKG